MKGLTFKLTHRGGYKMNREQAEKQEIISLLDALCDGNLELGNNEDHNISIGSLIKEQLDRLLSNNEKAYFLSSCVNESKCHFVGTPICTDNKEIWLNITEIEEQFEGEASEWFEDIDEWCINGNLAYLNVGYGLVCDVDVDKLKQLIDESIS